MKPWVRWFAIVGLAYGALWGLTASVGVESVRKVQLVAMGLGDPFSLSDTAPGTAQGSQAPYPLTVTAIAPFLVQTEVSYHCGPLCGVARTELFLWLPGLVHELTVIREINY